ncbi:MAG: hypothetical protein HUK03_07470, partial [Bacteroidaceae bacterium]|nr:hypothetical protein [Bacteroidaceae bacterium]
DSLIQLWLGMVPEYSVWFVRLTILQTLVVGIDIPVGRGIQAYGRMKLPNLTSAFVYMSILPISYVAMKLGASAYIVYWITITAYPGALLCDLWILHKYSGFGVWTFIKDVVIRCLSYCVIIGFIPTLIHTHMEQSLLRLVAVCATAGILSLLVIYYLGIPPHLRQKIVNQVKAKLGYA